MVSWHAGQSADGDEGDEEDEKVTVIELYVGLKCQYKNRKITHQSSFTVGTQVSTGDCYIHKSGFTTGLPLGSPDFFLRWRSPG